MKFYLFSVADGAGSAPYGQKGAEIITKKFIEILEKVLKSLLSSKYAEDSDLTVVLKDFAEYQEKALRMARRELIRYANKVRLKFTDFASTFVGGFALINEDAKIIEKAGYIAIGDSVIIGLRKKHSVSKLTIKGTESISEDIVEKDFKKIDAINFEKENENKENTEDEKIKEIKEKENENKENTEDEKIKEIKEKEKDRVQGLEVVFKNPITKGEYENQTAFLTSNYWEDVLYRGGGENLDLITISSDGLSKWFFDFKFIKENENEQLSYRKYKWTVKPNLEVLENLYHNLDFPGYHNELLKKFVSKEITEINNDDKGLIIISPKTIPREE